MVITFLLIIIMVTFMFVIDADVNNSLITIFGCRGHAIA